MYNWNYPELCNFQGTGDTALFYHSLRLIGTCVLLIPHNLTKNQ
ncbi:hypothetical protein SC09_contig10orf00074 [Bacillus subtilis]|uniref:Uncharacterized protein n=1 Tax=Bacillus subtilis TaxID=1423 RepID=A0A0D1KM49_BACIU|nr:hypothetical protein SC09_contig10orf00074 [Bacillus subtilis]